MIGTVLDYPRIANLYGFGSSTQVATFQRYGLVVAESPAAGTNGAVQALKTQSPASSIVVYLDTIAVVVPGFGGMTIYPGWWLTLAGTTLSAGLDSSSTTVYVTNASIINQNLSTNPDVLVDGESMHVTSVNTSANTLTVQRGYNSTTASHASGARIAAHVTNGTGTWTLNVTPYCPANPTTGQTWTAYLAATAISALASAPWDGIFFDAASPSIAYLSNGQVDANNDNVADGGDGPSGTGWADGETSLFSTVRSLAPSTLIVGNGAYYPGASNGEEFETFQLNWQGWPVAYASYLELAGPSGSAPITIVNPDTDDTGIQNLQTMRFNLATALMGNGYYAYDYGTTAHGQTWWYDEYDNGAGSSLASAVTNIQSTLPLVAGTGAKFKVGDIVRVPGDVNGYDDEQMLVTAINGDTLTVQRGYNGTFWLNHPAMSKVMTQAQIAAGQGWLGQPLGAATSLSPSGTSLLSNGDFEGTSASRSNGWSLNVSSPAVALLSQDSTTFARGQSSAKITVSTASPGVSWNWACLREISAYKQARRIPCHSGPKAPLVSQSGRMCSWVLRPGPPLPLEPAP